MSCSRSRNEVGRHRFLRLVVSRDPGESKVLRSVDDLRELRRRLKSSGLPGERPYRISQPGGRASDALEGWDRAPEAPGALESLGRIPESLEAWGRTPMIPGRAGTRVTVGLGLCGLMASADKIYDAIVDELAIRRITDVTVRRSGCLGFCGGEPTVVVDRPGSPATTYARVSPSGARRIVVQHVINGHVVREFLAGNQWKEDVR